MPRIVAQFPPRPKRYRVVWWHVGRLRHGWTGKEFSDLDDAISSAQQMWEADRSLEIQVIDLFEEPEVV